MARYYPNFPKLRTCPGREDLTWKTAWGCSFSVPTRDHLYYSQVFSCFVQTITVCWKKFVWYVTGLQRGEIPLLQTMFHNWRYFRRVSQRGYPLWPEGPYSEQFLRRLRLYQPWKGIDVNQSRTKIIEPIPTWVIQWKAKHIGNGFHGCFSPTILFRAVCNETMLFSAG